MIGRRLPVLLLELVIVVQAGFVAAVLPPAAAPALAAGECQVTSSAGGGVMSACPGADTLEEFTSELQLGFDGLRGKDATSSLSVTSTPAGAAVLLNGLESGTTPLDTTVPAGTYLVRVVKDGFAPYSKTVNVAAGRPGTVAATLAPVATSLGSFNWLRANSLIGQAGGYSDGQFQVTSFVRDRDGAYWVAFLNYADRQFVLDEPIDGPGFLPFLTKPRVQLKVSGVAKSTDAGASWTVVRSWSDSFSARAWTSDEFIDSQWNPVANGFPASFKKHTMRAYYNERTVEQYWVEDLIPRQGGGVSIVLYTYRATIPQELQYTWDNIANPNFPGEFMGEMTEHLADDPTFEEVSSGEAQAKWGVSREDLATYWWQASEDGRELVGSDGGESPMTISGVASYTVPKYQGSHDGVDYFLAYEPNGSDVGGVGYILASRDGGQTLTLDATYPLGDRANNRQPIEDLRIGPDGTKYLIVHYQYRGDVLESLIYEVGAGGQLRELGKTPPGVTIGVTGGNNLPFLSADFDSDGGMHAAFRGSITPDDNSTINVYYQYFPRQKPQYNAVALLTQPDCAGCQAAADFLRNAGVTFSENPTDLPAELAASAASEASSAGYPVLVRRGAANLVKGGADVASISRLLGVSYPVLVESHAPRRVQGSPYAALQPQWLLMVVEDDQPKIVFDRADGVVAMSIVEGSWTAAPLLALPDSVTDAPGIGFAKHYPAFPGGIGANFYSIQHDMPFNHINKLSEFVYLYHSASTAVSDSFGETNSQFDYTLWTTEAAPESSAYRVVQSASQLIPSAAFYVGLGEKGSPSNVSGELANYVTSESLITDDGDRLYRVVVDLRQQDETATAGSIVGRTIAGSVQVNTETADGAPEVRDVSLLLIVQNTRLRTFDPSLRAATRDITAEAVHFTGPDERWLVTNNIGLPNSIPCGADQSLVLDPFSVSTFTAAEVRQYDLSSCLAALEVAPTVLAECTSWDDAKLVIGAQTISSLAGSLPIMRSEDQTNWELSYGSRDATTHRIVAFDRPTVAEGGPPCGNETGERPATVVRVEGRFLGNGGEAYAPAITILDEGAPSLAAVETASKAAPYSLAWEREWLEFEASFLEANVRVSIDNPALAELVFLGHFAKVSTYKRHLMATRALLHCNQQGVGIAAISDLMARRTEIPAANRGTFACITDFALHPATFWPGYSKDYRPGAIFEVDFTGSIVDYSLTSNPTLAYLAASAGGNAIDYGEFVIARAVELEAGSLSSVSIDYVLDHYARVANAAARDMGGNDGRMLKAVLLTDQLERTAVNALAECFATMVHPEPVAEIVRLTSTHEYHQGIPCVDARAGAARIERFQLVGYGVHSGTFGALYDAAGRDLDLLFDLLADYARVSEQADALMAKYPASTSAAQWSPELPAADRFWLATRLAQATRQRHGQPLKVGELPQVLAGLKLCGTGLVEGLASVDGALSIGASAAAIAGGPLTTAIGGLAMLGFGVFTTGYGISDLGQAWETLDVSAKTAGVCGNAVGAILTIAGIDPVLQGATTFIPKQLRATPVKVLDVETLPRTGRSGGLSLEEQGQSIKPRGGTVKPVEPVAPRPLDAAFFQILKQVAVAERPAARAAAERLGYGDMTPIEQSVVRELVGKSPRVRALERTEKLAELSLAGKEGTPEYVAWDLTGAALLAELAPPLPKSIVVQTVPATPATPGGAAKPARLVGADAGVLQAIDNASLLPPGTEIVGTTADAIKARQPFLLQALLKSSRMLKALQADEVRAPYTPEEANAFLQRAQAVRPETTASFFSELSDVRIVEALRDAVANARQPGSTAQPSSLTPTLLQTGSSKVAVRLTIRLTDASVIDVVVSKGDITAAEAATYARLGPKNITANLRAPLLEVVDGLQALMITEYIPRAVEAEPGLAGLEKLYEATADADYAAAIGELDAQIWLETRDGSGPVPAGMAEYNTDSHLGNYNVFAEGNGYGARVTDFDPQFTHAADEAMYWTASMLRRANRERATFGFSVKNLDGYFAGVLRRVESAPQSSRAAALELLQRVRDNLRNKQVVAQARNFDGIVETATDAFAAETASLLDAFLARQSPGGIRPLPLAWLDGPFAALQPRAYWMGAALAA